MRLKNALLSALCAATLALGQHGSSTTVNPYMSPADRANGANLFLKQCAGCHGAEGIGAGAGPALNTGAFRRGGSDEALFQTITTGVPGTTMPAFKLTGLETWQLVTYLRSISVASRSSKPLGDAQAGAAIYAEKCAGCHSRGSAPDLTGIGMRKQVDDLRRAIVDPNADVAPEYFRVRITTNKGETITGTRLNEDTHSIQLRIQPGAKLHGYPRAQIQKLEWIRTSPMPAASQLSTKQIDDVIAYIAGDNSK